MNHPSRLAQLSTRFNLAARTTQTTRMVEPEPITKCSWKTRRASTAVSDSKRIDSGRGVFGYYRMALCLPMKLWVDVHTIRRPIRLEQSRQTTERNSHNPQPVWHTATQTTRYGARYIQKPLCASFWYWSHCGYIYRPKQDFGPGPAHAGGHDAVVHKFRSKKTEKGFDYDLIVVNQ